MSGDTAITVSGRRLKLTNTDKVLYPATGFTKGDVVDYYRRISPVLLPHLRNRPLTLKRYPNGVDGDFFYQKQAPKHRPDWVRTVAVRTEDRDIDFVLVNGLPTLLWLANLADLELHTSLARAASLERPTALVFDLDPGAPATSSSAAGWRCCCESWAARSAWSSGRRRRGQRGCSSTRR